MRAVTCALSAPAGPGRALLQEPSYTWLTASGQVSGCASSCAAQGPGWQAVNGGSPRPDFVMCAGLIDLPGLGEQWVVGSTLASLNQCQIKCPTKPCWILPPGAKHDYDTVTAGDFTSGLNPWTAADGSQQSRQFPMKCACEQCSGAVCNRLWAPPRLSSSCPRPSIPSQSAPSGVYSKACRSIKRDMAGGPDATYGYTGWVDTSEVPPACRNPYMGVAEYELWCPQAA